MIVMMMMMMMMLMMMMMMMMIITFEFLQRYNFFVGRDTRLTS